MKPTVSKLSVLVLLGASGAMLSGDLAAAQLAFEAAPVSVDRLAQADGVVTGEVVTVTGLDVEETDAGLQLTLATEGGILAEPDVTRTLGNALILEIPGAVLSESGFDEFQPTDGIALVQASELGGDRVQIAITGTEAPPTFEASPGASGLVISVTPGEPGSGNDDDAIQLSITGEGDDYFIPNATTATRTDTPLRDIPQSIQVISQEVLEDQGVIRLNDAIRNASGVVTGENEPRGQRFTIRGFNSSSVLRNGVRLTNGSTGNIGVQELANVEQVEVLKGPAGILFGVVEPGGVINLVTEQPLSTPRYEVGLQVGNREFLEPSIDFTGPLTADGSVRYRLNALYRTEDYHRDYNTPVERVFVAPVVAIDIDDDTDLVLELEYREDHRPNDFGLVAIGDEVADVPFDRALSNPDDEAEVESLRLGYRFEHRFDEDWKLRNSLFYNRSDSEVIINLSNLLVGAGVVPFVFNPETGDSFIYPASLVQPSSILDIQTNVVGEFNTGSIEHTLLAGVDFASFWDRGSQSLTTFPPDPTIINTLNIFNPDYSTLSTPDFDDDSFTSVLDSTGRTDALGVYLQDQVQLLDNLILLAGVRFDSVYQENTDSNIFAPPSESDREESAWTPRAGVVYQPSEDLSLYASYSQSFVPNTSTSVDGSFLDAERGEQFEIGARAELLDDNLLVNLALFNIEKDNVAVPDPNVPNFSINGGPQRSQGIELDIIGEILPGWNIVANYALMDTKITDNDDPNEGNKLRNAPDHVANLWTTYEFQSGTLEGLMVGAGFNYVSDRFGDLANSFTADDYFITNAVIAYDKDNWRAAVNFHNLFDIDYVETVGNSRNRGIHPGEGFTVIGSFAIEF